jgi:hypothetical protein
MTGHFSSDCCCDDCEPGSLVCESVPGPGLQYEITRAATAFIQFWCDGDDPADPPTSQIEIELDADGNASGTYSGPEIADEDCFVCIDVFDICGTRHFCCHDCCIPTCTLRVTYLPDTDEHEINWGATACSGPQGGYLVEVVVDGVVVFDDAASQQISTEGTIVRSGRPDARAYCMTVENSCGAVKECCDTPECCYTVNRYLQEYFGFAPEYTVRCDWPDGPWSQIQIRGLDQANGSHIFPTVGVPPPTICCPVEDKSPKLLGEGEIEFRGEFYPFTRTCFDEFGNETLFSFPSKSYRKITGNLYLIPQGNNCHSTIVLDPLEVEQVQFKFFKGGSIFANPECGQLQDCPDTTPGYVGEWGEDSNYCLFRFSHNGITGGYQWEKLIGLTDLAFGYSCPDYQVCGTSVTCDVAIRILSEFVAPPPRIICVGSNQSIPTVPTCVGSADAQGCIFGYAESTVSFYSA